MQLRYTNDGFNSIWIHVDNFKVVAKDPSIYIALIDCVFLVKEYIPYKYRLGDGYKFYDVQVISTYGVHIYIRNTDTQIIIYFRAMKLNCSTTVFEKIIPDFFNDCSYDIENLNPGFLRFWTSAAGHSSCDIRSRV